MSKTDTLVLRVPTTQKSGQNGQNKMGNLGVAFLDDVNMEDTETGSIGKRTVIHLLPSQPLTKGATFFVFPGRGRQLPDSIVAHAAVSDKRHRDPSHVLYHDDEPVGSAWIHTGSRSKFLVVKVNKPVDLEAQADGIGKRFTLFPRFVKEAGTGNEAV